MQHFSHRFAHFFSKKNSFQTHRFVYFSSVIFLNKLAKRCTLPPPKKTPSTSSINVQNDPKTSILYTKAHILYILHRKPLANRLIYVPLQCKSNDNEQNQSTKNNDVMPMRHTFVELRRQKRRRQPQATGERRLLLAHHVQKRQRGECVSAQQPDKTHVHSFFRRGCGQQQQRRKMPACGHHPIGRHAARRCGDNTNGFYNQQSHRALQRLLQIFGTPDLCHVRQFRYRAQ